MLNNEDSLTGESHSKISLSEFKIQQVL